MGALSIWHWLIVLAVILLLFGSKKLPEMARGLGRSARIFKSEIKEMQNDGSSEDEDSAQQPQAITQGGQPQAAQYAQPQAQQYAQPQGQQPQSQQYAQPQGYPQAPQQPYQQPAPQQGQSQQPGQQQFTDPTAPYNGGQGQTGQ